MGNFLQPDLGDYYGSQLSKLKPDEYGIKIKLSTTGAETNWINLNKESAKKLRAFLKRHKL